MRVNRRRTKILYEIECEDSRGIENASPAFLFAPTSHSISYKIFVLLFVDSRWNQLFNLWERGGRQTPLKKVVLLQRLSNIIPQPSKKTRGLSRSIQFLFQMETSRRNTSILQTLISRKVIDFWENPLFFPYKILISSGAKEQKTRNFIQNKM